MKNISSIDYLHFGEIKQLFLLNYYMYEIETFRVYCYMTELSGSGTTMLGHVQVSHSGTSKLKFLKN